MKTKIIIGPAKTFNNITPSKNIKPKYIKKSNELKKIIEKFSIQEIIKRYKISEKKAKEVFEYKNDKNTYPAIALFGGLVFKQLNLNSYDKDWLNENVLIIDPLYGPLKPFDSISKYRLDMKTKIDINLKECWIEEIKNELKGFKVINLASKEYSSWLTGVDIVEPKLDSKIKQIKIARGKLLDKLIFKI